MIEYITLALSSLKAAKEVIATIQNIRDFDKISIATTELKEHLIETIDSILSTKEQLLTFQDRITNLEQENNRLINWTAQKEKYTLKLIANGSFAYVNNESKENLQNSHKLCCNCFDKTIISTLQQEYFFGHANNFMLHCPNGCPPLKFREYIDD
jgi:hypothetical protein